MWWIHFWNFQRKDIKINILLHNNQCIKKTILIPWKQNEQWAIKNHTLSVLGVILEARNQVSFSQWFFHKDIKLGDQLLIKKINFCHFWKVLFNRNMPMKYNVLRFSLSVLILMQKFSDLENSNSEATMTLDICLFGFFYQLKSIFKLFFIITRLKTLSVSKTTS